MALSQTEIQAVTEDYVLNRGEPVDIYAVDHVLIWFLLGKGKFQEGIVKAGDTAGGGEYITAPVEYARANKGAYGNDTILDISRTAIFNAVRFGWGGVYASATIDLKDQREAFGDPAIVNLVQGKIRSIDKSIGLQLAIHCYNGSGPANDQIDGTDLLFDLAGAGTSTKYGDLAEADISKWATQWDGSTAKTMGFQFMQELFRDAKVGAGKKGKPTVVCTVDLLKDAFELSQQTQQRYQDPELARAGFDNILFHSVPIVADEVLETEVGRTNDVYAFNLNYLKLMSHPKYAFTKPVWRVKDVQYPDVYVADSRWQGNLICTHRASHSGYGAVSAPS